MVKVIYCYTAPRSLDHKDMVKVGQTTFSTPNDVPTQEEITNAAKKRIHEQNGTGGHYAPIQWVEGFVMGDNIPNGNLSDHDVHHVLIRNGYDRVNWSDIYNDYDEDYDVNGGREWFYATPEQAHTALESVMSNVQSMPIENPGQREIVLREEQQRFVDHTLKAMLNGADKYLWNAKMRFGKTLTAYKLIEASQNTDKPIRKALIITHRPSVREGWFDDFSLTFSNTDWKFGAKEAGANWEELENGNDPYVYFLSIQDLRGKTDGAFKDTNKGVFNTKFDMLIIDEAHEGVETELAQEVSANISRDFTLNLSGTPYRYISTDAFSANEMSSWDYVQEQEAKNNWNDEDGDNPYAKLAKMWLYTVDISKQTEEKFETYEDDAFFDFNQFFETTKGSFTHSRTISRFLNSLHADEEEVMPFGNHFRENNRHSLWVLPSVKACESMKDLLENDAFFKDYTVINVAGADSAESKNPVQSVKKAIGTKKNNGHKTKTITLTVGRLTTGTTVEEWTSVLFLRNTNSAEFYMQTIFRVQTPWTNADGKVKTDVMVWDFAPDRTLRVFTEVSGMSAKAGEKLGADKREVLNDFLNYLPVLARIDGQDIKKVDANDIMIQLKRAYADRVTRSGFESNDLIVKDLTTLPPHIREALDEIRIANGNNGPELNTKANYDITISDNDLSNKTDTEIDKETKELEKEPAKERSEADKEALQARKEEMSMRDTMRNLLKSISVRIPIMTLALMGDEDYKNEVLTTSDFNLKDFTDKIDDESWVEFFQKITKEQFEAVIPAFDTDVLQISIQKWVRDIDDALSFRDEDVDEFYSRISTILQRLRNPNKETVLTPFSTAQLVYEAAGFTEDGEGWKDLRTNRRPQKFYDINIKSGVFSMIAAVNIMRHKHEDLGNWANVCNSMVFANSRTLAGKWITCAVLGMPKDWANISVVDVHEEWVALDQYKLSDESKTYVIKNILSDSIFVSDDTINDVEKKRENWIERGRMADKLRRQLAKNPDEAVRINDEILGLLGDEEGVFDHVVSNPPYQIASHTNKNRNIAIWPEFLVSAVAIGKSVSMINPARWVKGGPGTGLTSVREWILNNKRLTKYYTMKDTDAFPGTIIRGGVCIEVFSPENRKSNIISGKWEPATGWHEEYLVVVDGIDIPMNNKNTLVLSSILNWNQANESNSIAPTLWNSGASIYTKSPTKVSPSGSEWDYGLVTQRMYRDQDCFLISPPKEKDYIKVSFLKSKEDETRKENRIGNRFIGLEEIREQGPSLERISSYQIAMPRTEGKSLYRRIMPIAPPNETYSSSWVSKGFKTLIEAENFETYLKTYFYRYLVALRITSQDARVNVHRFVPDIENIVNPRTGLTGYHSDWTDDDLRELLKDHLTDDDWRYIKSEAVKADKGKGNYEAGWKFPDGSTHHSLSL